MANSLRSNFSWSLVGNIIYALCQWLMLVIIARLGDAKDVGIYSLALAISAPIMQFLGMNLRVAIATDQKGEFSIQDYLVLRALSSSLGIVVIASISLVWHKEQQHIIIAMILVSFAKAVESMSDVCYGLFQKHERNDLISQSLILRGTLTTSLFGLTYYYFRSLTQAIAIMASVWLTALLVFDARKLRTLSFTQPSRQSHTPNIFRLIIVVAPLGFGALLDSLTPNVTRYAVEIYFGLEQLGYFSAIAYLMVAGGTVVGALGYAVTPRMARLFLNDDLSSFLRVGAISVLAASGVGVFGVLVSVFFGKQLLGLFYGEKYMAYQPCLVIIMLASALWYAASLTGCMLNAARSFGHQMLANGLALLAVAISVLVIGRPGGINGMAWALTIGMGARLFSSLGFVLIGIRRRAR